MTRVTVSPLLIQWALERAPQPATIRKKFPKLSEWLRGSNQPTLRQLEEFSKATFTPFGYFFLPTPPDERLPIPLFRTISDEPVLHPSPNLLEVVRIMERRQAWLRQYLTEQGYEPLPFVRSAQLSTPPEQIALDIRRTLGLDEAWAAKQPNWTAALRELQTRIEAARITVAASSIVGNHPRRRLDPTEFRGFVLVDEYAPLVFLNSADFKAAQMFTLAHELAHIWLGTSAAFDLRHLQPAKDKTEQLCDRAAAEFLVPASELRDIWPSVAPQADPFQAIARRFKVSAIVAARRALDLKLITKETFYAFYDKYQERQRHVTGRGKERGNFYATQTVRLGRFFSKTVIQAVRQGSLLYHDAYRLTGLYGRTFDRFVNYLTGPLP